MKRLVVACSFMTATAFLLVSCRNSENTENNNPTAQIGNKKMTRTKMASGLEYEILQEGSGDSPKKGKLLSVHYTGWLNNNNDEPGKKFDSSLDRNQPFGFVIGYGRVIKGWDEGVMTMKVGEKRRLFIPADLGYGASGAGSLIPANADLIFDVELIQIL